jgi:hypothetical protein
MEKYRNFVSVFKVPCKHNYKCLADYTKIFSNYTLSGITWKGDLSREVRTELIKACPYYDEEMCQDKIGALEDDEEKVIRERNSEIVTEEEMRALWGQNEKGENLDKL